MKLNKQTIIRALPWLIIILVIVYSAAAAVADAEFIWPHAPDWSRGKRLGTTIAAEPTSIAIDENDNSYIAILGKNGYVIHALTRAGDARWEQLVDSDFAKATHMRLAWSQDQLHLSWLEEGELIRAALDESGNIVAAPTPLSFPISVENFAVAVNDAGVHLWASGERAELGIYAIVGNSAPQLIDIEGREPQLLVGEGGGLQAVWNRPVSNNQSTYVYAGTSADGSWFQHPVEIIQLTNNNSTRIRGPWFAIESGHGYLAWTTDLVGGISSGQSFSKYVTFDLQRSGAISQPLDLIVPFSRSLTYEPSSGDIVAGERILLDNPRGRRANPLEGTSLITYNGGNQESLLGVRVSVAHLKRKEVTQAALYFFDDGEPTAYQLISFSAKGSSAVSVAQQPAGTLIATWLEQSESGGYSVYLAGTHDEIKENYATLVFQDYRLMIMQAAFGMLQSLVFSPFAFVIWGFIPLIVLGISSGWRERRWQWTDSSVWIPVTIAGLVFWFAKYITLKPALSYIPFSAWIQAIPSWLNIPLQLFIPLLCAAAACYAAYRLVVLRKNDSLLAMFVVYAIVDTLLIMAIYGGALYDAF